MLITAEGASIVQTCGTLGCNLVSVEKICGATNCNDIIADAVAAFEERRVVAIVREPFTPKVYPLLVGPSASAAMRLAS